MTASTAPLPTPVRLQAPSLRRRMACWLYEGLLLFGVVFVAGLLLGALGLVVGIEDQRHWLQLGLFVLCAVYCVYFWVRGQTLAMKTWRLQVVDRQGAPLTRGRALGRYVLSWLWLLPPLAVVGPYHLPMGETTVLVLGWVLVWALLSRFHPERQFLHDALAGTRIVDATPPAATR